MMDSSDLEDAAPSENENPESDGNSIEIPENSEEVTALESAPEVEPDMSEIQEISMESEELADAEEVMEIPDRKAIYLENEHNVEAIDENAEIKNENEEE